MVRIHERKITTITDNETLEEGQEPSEKIKEPEQLTPEQKRAKVEAARKTYTKHEKQYQQAREDLERQAGDREERLRQALSGGGFDSGAAFSQQAMEARRRAAGQVAKETIEPKPKTKEEKQEKWYNRLNPFRKK